MFRFSGKGLAQTLMWDTFLDVGDGCPLEGWSQLFATKKALRSQWESLAGDGGLHADSCI